MLYEDKRRLLSLSVSFFLGALSGACGSPPELGVEADQGDDAADADSNAGDDGGDGLSGDDGEGGDGSGTGGTGNPPQGPHPCELVSCGLGQRCELVQKQASCVDNTCEVLDCGELEDCAPAVGGGFYCQSAACSADVECSPSQHCDGTRCVLDVCEPETRSCSGSEVLICASNGGSSEARFVCAGGPYFESSCESFEGAVGCICQDDWDCPAHTACEAGVCAGTGEAATCSLPPLPFGDVLPRRKFRWGGEKQSAPQAVGSPFPASAHVSSTPLVANLTDDNGDGLIDERDFPEILFISYRQGDDVRRNGVVRAVHGGGPERGQDYFARCGNALWSKGEPVLGDADCNYGHPKTEPFALPGGTAAVGDIDGDGIPEIVVPTERRSLLILDNRGHVITETVTRAWPGGPEASSSASAWNFPAVSIANVDHQGLAEAVVGNRVFTFKMGTDTEGAPRLEADRVFTGELRVGAQASATGEFAGVSCVGDVVRGRPGLEIVAGATAYALPARPAGEGDPCAESGNANSDYCQGKLTVVWDTRTSFGSNEAAGGLDVGRAEGYCAIADVWGSDTTKAPGPLAPLDGAPEVVLIANGWLVLLEGETGRSIRTLNLGGGQKGGAPNIDDFDGDGFPEIATALSDFYRVIDLQEPEAEFCPAWTNTLGKTAATPGANVLRDPGGACSSDAACNAGSVCSPSLQRCVCLHNGWQRATEDNSSQATSSSVFDFNGDGAAEVAYNDECYFRVYDGATGAIHLAIPSLSRTVIENPVIADVDNDGNAEIVTVTNTELIQCGEAHLAFFPVPEDPAEQTVVNTSLPNGIEVWGAPGDSWVSARRIWNQQSYHVTNVTESGRIPEHEPENYQSYNGRLYNSYRSQPRAHGVAPDLAVTAIQVSSPDLACGQLSNEIEIAVLVENRGDLRVGPGVGVSFTGVWEPGAVEAPLTDEAGEALVVPLEKSLEPGSSVLVSVRFSADHADSGTLPAKVRAIVDAEDVERECLEDNNAIEAEVTAGEALADLRLEFVSASGCAPGKTRVQVINQGSLAAVDALVRIYAGDPSQGGRALADVIVSGALEPGKSVSLDVDLGSIGRHVTLFGVIDPLGSIVECNNANNYAVGPRLECGTTIVR